MDQLNQNKRDLPRRSFLKASVAAGLAGAPAVLAQRSSSNTIGVACIGVGTRGSYLLSEFQQIPGVEVRIISDLYEGNIRRAKGICRNPNVRIVREWEKAVDDPDIQAVVIATPDFWHPPMTIRAANAKKDIYVEKGWSIRLDEAKAMRKAVKENNVVMQLGHNWNSEPAQHRAREIYRSGVLGKVPMVRLFMDRTSAFQEFKYYTDYMIKQAPADASPQTIDWNRYITNAPKRPFDIDRFFTWRCYWDYGTGTAGDLMSHLWDSVNMVIGMGIPETAMSQGAMYFWKEQREVPDIWNMVFDYPKQELQILFASVFHNRHSAELLQYLGREKTMETSQTACRTYRKEWGDEHKVTFAKAKAEAIRAGQDPAQVQLSPDYWFKEGELKVTSHWQDFIDCVRTRERPRCHVDRAFQEAATIMMAVEALRKKREVRWDPIKEVIV
jgi:predicted dehydrogenase